MKYLECDQTLKELLRADLRKMPIALFMKKVKPLYEIYKHTAICWKNNKVLYRARKIGKKDEILLKKDLTYPDPEKTTIALGRANFENNPVFYASGTGAATLFELGLEIGDKVVISTWLLKKKTWLFPLGYNQNFFDKLGSGRKCPNIIPPTLRIEEKLNKKISDFFSDLFTRKCHDFYLHTAGIGFIIF